MISKLCGKPLMSSYGTSCHTPLARGAPLLSLVRHFPRFAGELLRPEKAFIRLCHYVSTALTFPAQHDGKKLSCHPEIGLLDRLTKDPAARRTPNKNHSFTRST